MAAQSVSNATPSSQESPSGRFLDLVVRATLADFPPSDPAEKKELNQIFWNRLFDLPGPKTPQPRKSPEDRFLAALIWGNIEVQKVANVRGYFRRSPRGLDPNSDLSISRLWFMPT